jgi:hypothetical protein
VSGPATGTGGAREARLLAAVGAAAALLSIWYAWVYRFHVNSDAAIYMELGRHWAAMDLGRAVVGYWGPLLPALSAIPMALGVPTVAAGKVVAFLAWCGWVIALRAFLARTMPARRADALVLAGAIPYSLVYGSTYSVLPDTLLSLACIGLGAALLSDARRPRASTALLAGVACGVAYLCKPPSWMLLLLPAAAVVAVARRSREPGALARAAGAVALVVAGFALAAGPWIAAVSHRSGRFTMGTATPELTALNYGKLGIPTPKLDRWHPDEDGIELLHNPWVFRVRGSTPVDVRLPLQYLPRNAREFGLISLASPLLAVGLLAAVLRARRSLRSRTRWIVPAFAVWLVAVLFLRKVEPRWCLYAMPFALAAAGTIRLPDAFRPAAAWRRRGFIVATALALLCVARYRAWTPLGRARISNCAAAAPSLPAGGRVWFNSTAWGVPCAFLLDLRPTLTPPWGEGTEKSPVPDVVVWGEIEGNPNLAYVPERTRGFEEVRAWTDEDGIRMRILRRAP